MSDINWILPASLFSGVNALLALLPETKPVEIKIERPIEELLAGIDLGGFTMQEREITEEDLKALTASFSAGQALTVQGRAVALYIEDRTGMMHTTDVEQLPKVHIVNCGTTEKNPGRYVMVINPTGEFGVTFAGERAGRRLAGRERATCKLRVCESCKRCLKGQRHGLVGKFNLAGQYGAWSAEQWTSWNRFIASQAGATLPVPVQGVGKPYRQAGAAPMDSLGYPSDWQEISRRRREAEAWTCSDCKVNCSHGKLRQFLDSHHENRNKQDSTDANLRVLCRLCHREQGLKLSVDDHEWLVTHRTEVWKEACSLIKAARIAQGITRNIPPAFKT